MTASPSASIDTTGLNPTSSILIGWPICSPAAE
jgi:hypothetical protein